MTKQADTTLRDLIEAGRKAAKDAWWEARNAYYKGSRAAGKALSKAKRDIPQGLRSLGDFVRESERGGEFLKKKSPEAQRNIKKMMRELKKK